MAHGSFGSFAWLEDRGVVFIGGTDAKAFLQDIITTDMVRVGTHGAGFGALLSPQGKILFDFVILAGEDGFWFDLSKPLVADFIKRMTLYRLRAKVEIRNHSDTHRVAAVWDIEAARALADGFLAADPRLEALGFRAILPASADLATSGLSAATEADYHTMRIGLGVPEGGRDFAFGDAFPHDVDMDDLGGLDFRKGCYVGQEIVSRMEHRGTARRRAVQIGGSGPLPGFGAAIEADGKPLGTLGSSAGDKAIAVLRLDRTKRALDDGQTVTADGLPISIALPAFAKFGWPAGAGDEEGAA